MILILCGPTRPVDGLVRGLRAEGQSVRIARDVDLGSMQAVRAAVKDASARAVVLAAGLDDLEACEGDEPTAFAHNAERAINVAAATLEFSAVPVLLSSAEVFGQSGGPWSEADAPEAASVFAESKLRGEKFIVRASPAALVLRVGPVLEDGLPDLAAVIEAGVEAADDEMVSPVGGADLGRALHALLAAGTKGVVHVANRGAPVSRAGLLSRAAEALGLDSGRVRAGSGRGLSRRATWARAATLHTDRLDKVLAAPLRAWTTALDEAATFAPERTATSVAHVGPVAQVAPVTQVAPVAPSGPGGAVEVFTPAPTTAEFGTELRVVQGPGYAARMLCLEPGRQVSLGQLSSESHGLHVLEGKVLLDVLDEGAEADHVLRAGRSVRVEAGANYRLTAVDAATVLFVAAGAPSGAAGDA